MKREENSLPKSSSYLELCDISKKWKKNPTDPWLMKQPPPQASKPVSEIHRWFSLAKLTFAWNLLVFIVSYPFVINNVQGRDNGWIAAVLVTIVSIRIVSVNSTAVLISSTVKFSCSSIEILTTSLCGIIKCHGRAASKSICNSNICKLLSSHYL